MDRAVSSGCEAGLGVSGMNLIIVMSKVAIRRSICFLGWLGFWVLDLLPACHST